MLWVGGCGCVGVCEDEGRAGKEGTSDRFSAEQIAHAFAARACLATGTLLALQKAIALTGLRVRVCVK